jgi:hypothetical protein
VNSIERRKSQSKLRDSVMFNSLARFDKSGSQRSEEMFTSDSKQEPGESESKSERGDWSLGSALSNSARGNGSKMRGGTERWTICDGEPLTLATHEYEEAKDIQQYSPWVAK